MLLLGCLSSYGFLDLQSSEGTHQKSFHRHLRKSIQVSKKSATTEVLWYQRKKESPLSASQFRTETISGIALTQNKKACDGFHHRAIAILDSR